MTYEAFNAFCKSLPATTYVVQWGGSHVWKVGGKVFAIGGLSELEGPTFTFKVDAITYDVLHRRPGLRPAPYFASRGMTWIQHHAATGGTDVDLREFLTQSHRIVASGLTKRLQRELGLLPA